LINSLHLRTQLGSLKRSCYFSQFIVTLVLYLEQSMNLPIYQVLKCVHKRWACHIFSFSILVFPFIISTPCLSSTFS